MIKTDRSGFTLPEVAVVLAVGCILMGIAVPMFDSTYRGSNADAAAQLLAQQLSYARALAVGSHTPVLVQVDLAANTVTVAPGTGSERGPMVLPGRMEFGSTSPGGDTPDQLGGTVLGTVHNSEMTFLDNGAVVHGALSNDVCSGTFFLHHQSGADTNLRAVTLLGGTGRVRVWRYDEKSHEWK